MSDNIVQLANPEPRLGQGNGERRQSGQPVLEGPACQAEELGLVQSVPRWLRILSVICGHNDAA